MNSWMILLPVLTMALGVALLIRGLRGRRVDDHPICRRCGFDLFNRPQTSEHCPECGAELAAPKAIRLGRRERRKLSAAAGVILLAIVAAGAVFLLYGKNWDRYKPPWLLALEAEDPARGAGAAAELLRRLAAAELSNSQIASAADRFLALQGDWSRPWPAPCGDFLEAARNASKLTNDRYDRYIRQAPQLVLKLPPAVRRGESLLCYLKANPPRLGTGPPMSGWFDQMHGRIGNAPYKPQLRPGFDPLRANLASCWSIPLAEFGNTLTNGTQSLDLTLVITIPGCDRPIVVNVEAAFELLPASSPGAEERRDPTRTAT